MAAWPLSPRHGFAVGGWLSPFKLLPKVWQYQQPLWGLVTFQSNVCAFLPSVSPPDVIVGQTQRRSLEQASFDGVFVGCTCHPLGAWPAHPHPRSRSQEAPP